MKQNWFKLDPFERMSHVLVATKQTQLTEDLNHVVQLHFSRKKVSRKKGCLYLGEISFDCS
jgi:hypothetical protein